MCGLGCGWTQLLSRALISLARVHWTVGRVSPKGSYWAVRGAGAVGWDCDSSRRAPLPWAHHPGAQSGPHHICCTRKSQGPTWSPCCQVSGRCLQRILVTLRLVLPLRGHFRFECTARSQSPESKPSGFVCKVRPLGPILFLPAFTRCVLWTN